MGYLATLIRAATPENPRFNLNDPQAWDALVDGPPSPSGVHVTRETALTYSPWWRGINLIARDVGKLPLYIYRRQGDGKERASDHPAYRLLLRKPNEAQTALEFRSQLTAHALAGGNGYAYVARTGGGEPLELLPLDPDCTYPVRANGKLHYVTEVDGSPRKLFAADVLHIKGLSWDGLSGISVVQKARETLGLGLGAQRSQAVAFKNGARPSVVLEAAAVIDEKTKQTLRESWERMHSGIDNAHRTAILDRGLKASRLGFSAEDQQLIETRQFGAIDIANFLGVPPHKLGDTGRTAYASLEQENQSYLDDALDFWLTLWEFQCWDKLLTEEEKSADTHVVEFLRLALLRADTSARANYFRTALGGRGWMTPNEVRGRENLNPSDSPDADEVLTPLNMGQGGPRNDPPPSAPPKPKPAGWDAARGVMADAARRVVRRIAVHAARAANAPAEFSGWVYTFAADHGSVVADILAPATALAASLTGRAVADAAPWLLAELQREYDDASGRVTAAKLAAEVAALNARLEIELPARAVARAFDDGDDPCATPA